MNERILKIVEQAEILFYKGRIPETGYEYEGAEVTKEDLQKLAELIVKECALIVAHSPWRFKHGYKAIDQANLVKQHFGVE
jgi:hypothetical protein